MKPKLFIDRPILAACISALILMLGIIGLVNLPMEQYPDIAPPTVQVSATYTGASAATVQKAVIVPLEEEINGVENMMYMTPRPPIPAAAASTSISSREPTRTWPPSTCRTV